jgi:recombination protein RecA
LGVFFFRPGVPGLFRIYTMGRPRKTPTPIDSEDKPPLVANSPEQQKDWDFVAKVVTDMDKACGKNTALVPNSSTILGSVENWVSTGNFMLDWAIAGGLPLETQPIIPFGRITEIAGLSGVGKTTVLCQIIAETQKLKGVGAIIDVEHSLDISYMEKLGVDLSRIVVVPADTYEEGFQKAKILVHSITKHDPDRLVTIGWDSIGATPTQAQMDSDDGSNPHGVAAKVVGQNLQAFNGLIAKHNIGMVFTNHVWQDQKVKYGDPYKSYAGEKFRFFATLRLRLTRTGKISEKDDSPSDDDTKQTIGNRVKLSVLKNKMAPYLKVVEVACMGGLGFSEDYSVFEQSQKQGLIKGSTWKEWTTDEGEVVKFQSWKGFQDLVMAHPKYQSLVSQVKTNFLTKAG